MPATVVPELYRSDIQALFDLLSDVLTGASCSKTMVETGAMWDALMNERCPEMFSSSDFSGTFKGSRDQVRRFKGVFRTLSALTNSLEQAIDHTEKCIAAVAMHHGLARLPSELLSLIFWHAASALADAIQLCQVCSRFRTIMLASPEIWAKYPLMLKSTPTQIMTIVERSGNMPLRARIEPIPYFSMKASGVLDHSARLQELVISPVNDPSLHPQFDAIQLPSLRSLSMSWSKYISSQQSVQIQRVGQADPHMYETWFMPQLRFLEANFVPHPLPGIGIVQCELTFGEDSIYVNELLVFLGSTPFLRKLSISFAHTSAWYDDKPDANVELPNLRALSIQISGKTSSSLLSRILSSLACENVAEFSFNMIGRSQMDEDYHSAFDTYQETTHPMKDADFTGWRREAVRFMQWQGRVRSLSVGVDVTQRRIGSTSLPPFAVESLRDILSNIPSSLETLVLSRCISVHWDTKQTDCIAPWPIDCIYVTDSNPCTLGLLEIFRDVVTDRGRGPRRIVVDQCTPKQGDEIRALFTRCGVLWETRT
ncbi:hypothetical protein ACEPAF_1657 [Sanghuangporus sanghuang]